MRSSWSGDRPVRRTVPCVALALIASCAGDRVRTYEFGGRTMGTTYTVKVVADELPDAVRAALDEGIVADLDLVNRLMSHYMDTSELSRFNDHADTTPFPISAETAEVFRWSLEIGERTGGALDVTVGPLVDAWGFGPPGQSAGSPSDAEIERLLDATGNDHLELDEDASTLRKASPGLRCDLSATAKGYAVDRIADRLIAAGLDRFLVEVGGEIRALGTNDLGNPWQVAVERPESPTRAVQRMVPMREGAMATSGDYRNYYEVDGRRVSHIIDPRTGRPIVHRLASVSVLDALCVRADALATALLVLGPDDGYRLAEEMDVAALFLVREDDGAFVERTTPRFDAILAGQGAVTLPDAPGALQ